jgi:hypothetical protein
LNFGSGARIWKKKNRKEKNWCNVISFCFWTLKLKLTETNTCTSNFMLSYIKENYSAPKFPVLYFHKLVHLYSLSKGSKLKSQQQPKRHQWVIKKTKKKYTETTCIHRSWDINWNLHSLSYTIHCLLREKYSHSFIWKQ